MAEQTAVNRQVTGSSPVMPANLKENAMYNLVRAWRTFRNKCKYKNSPNAVKAEIMDMVMTCLFKDTKILVRELDNYEGVVDYYADSTGKVSITLASGIKIVVNTTIENVNLD